MNHKITIAIASGKGGTGKTFVSTNLFNTLVNRGLSTTLTDCDAEEPNDREFIDGELIEQLNVTRKIPVIDKNRCIYCGMCYEYCNYQAIFFLREQNIIKVLEEQCHGCGACSVACGFDAITEKDVILGTVSRFKVANSGELIEARVKVGIYTPVFVIKKAVQESRNSTITILDSPPGISCSFVQTVANVDYVVLVTEPTPFGLSDLKQSVATLKNLKKRYGVIINRDGKGNNDVIDYLTQENIPLLMSIPFDKEIALCYSNGNLLTNLYPEWDQKFYHLYKTIITNYDNCNNKR
ncbi:MAG TPA: ATP-binding protein [Bacteroidaceae bacterium]|nr:ATP-binding protein [Bacteroidaceae bacterium]